MSKYADATEPACRLCGRAVKRVVPEGAPYYNCEKHGKLPVSDVLGIDPNQIPDQ